MSKTSISLGQMSSAEVSAELARHLGALAPGARRRLEATARGEDPSASGPANPIGKRVGRAGRSGPESSASALTLAEDPQVNVPTLLRCGLHADASEGSALRRNEGP